MILSRVRGDIMSGSQGYYLGCAAMSSALTVLREATLQNFPYAHITEGLHRGFTQIGFTPKAHRTEGLHRGFTQIGFTPNAHRTEGLHRGFTQIGFTPILRGEASHRIFREGERPCRLRGRAGQRTG